MIRARVETKCDRCGVTELIGPDDIPGLVRITVWSYDDMDRCEPTHENYGTYLPPVAKVWDVCHGCADAVQTAIEGKA
jgi:hypothetical protein